MFPLMHPRQLLLEMASGEAVSGAALARQLGVTRAAVWKHIEAMRLRGLPVDAQAGSGYRLPWPVQLLDAADISTRLGALPPGPLEVHWELDSTSSELQRRENAADLSFVLAESQTDARGRRGRSWVSPPALNIYLSCLKRFDAGFAALTGLSLAVGVAVMRALDDLGVAGAGLKWPNDVLVGEAKLGGVLIELSGEFQGPCSAIVGVGLNVRLPPALRSQLGQAATDLASLEGPLPDRNEVAARLIARLAECLVLFEREGFAAFADEYRRHDLLHGRPLLATRAGERLQGVGAGVDARGALRIKTADGEVRLGSAEVTVRAQ